MHSTPSWCWNLLVPSCTVSICHSYTTHSIPSWCWNLLVPLLYSKYCLFCIFLYQKYMPSLFNDKQECKVFAECKPTWATAWQNQQNDLCTQQRLGSAWASAQSDQSSLSTWRNLGSLAPHWVHSEDWSDWVDAQADLSLHWAHWTFCWFCLAATHI